MSVTLLIRLAYKRVIQNHRQSRRPNINERQKNKNRSFDIKAARKLIFMPLIYLYYGHVQNKYHSVWKYFQPLSKTPPTTRVVQLDIFRYNIRLSGVFCPAEVLCSVINPKKPQPLHFGTNHGKCDFKTAIDLQRTTLSVVFHWIICCQSLCWCIRSDVFITRVFDWQPQKDRKVTVS